MTGGLLEITLEDDDDVEMTTDSGFVKIGGSTTAYSASAVEEFIVHAGPGNNDIDLSAVDDSTFTSLDSISLFGGAGNDSITGSGLADLISGAWGDDTLSDNEGNDLLLGGGDDDSLAGGLGDDIYAFESSDNGSDCPLAGQRLSDSVRFSSSLLGANALNPNAPTTRKGSNELNHHSLTTSLRNSGSRRTRTV